MRRIERVHGYLVRDGVRIAIRSSLVAQELESQAKRIEALEQELAQANAERSSLAIELTAATITLDWVRRKPWVRIGIALGLVRHRDGEART